MQKHPKMSLVAAAPVCTFTIHILQQPVQVSPYAFQRYLRKSALMHSTPTLRSYALPCGCYVLVHYSGLRQLSTLPF